MNTYRRIVGIAFLALLLALVGTAAQSVQAQVATPGKFFEVSITENGYSPALLSVPLMSTVRWTNNGDGVHTVTSRIGGLFDSGPLEPGQTFSFKFVQLASASSGGGFDYTDLNTGAIGRILVQASNSDNTGQIVVGKVVNVAIRDFFFDPNPIKISVGTTVKWTNLGGVVHTSTSDKLLWDSGDILPGNSFSYRFMQVGTFDYHDRYHAEMIGTVVVVGTNSDSGAVTQNGNLAFHRPVTASSAVQGHPARLAVDGLLRTDWRPMSLPAWIYVDLGQQMTVNRAVVRWTADSQNHTFQLFAQSSSSQSGGQWVRVFDGIRQGPVSYANFGPIQTRYMMLYIPASLQHAVGVREFEVYGIGGAGASKVVPVPGDLPPDMPVIG